MPDAEWVQDFELSGAERADALTRARDALLCWEMAMPAGEPLVIHFGLNDFPWIGEIEFWIVNDCEKGYCGKFLFLFEGQRCPRHHHRIKDETFFIVKGMVEMEANSEQFTMREGESYNINPGVSHTFAATGGPALILEVSLPSIQGDNFFEDRRIGRDGVI